VIYALLISAHLNLIISRESARYRLDPRLVRAVIRVESGYRRTLCYKGAYGYMQIQTSSRKCNLWGWLEAVAMGLFDAETNIRRGVKLMRMWRDYCTRVHHRGHHWLLHYNQGYGVCPHGRYCPTAERIPILSGHVGGYARRVLEYAGR